MARINSVALAALALALLASAQNRVPEPPVRKPPPPLLRRDAFARRTVKWICPGVRGLYPAALFLPGDPSYQLAFKKIYDERKANKGKDDPSAVCLPNGAVRITALPYKIIQTPNMVILLSEGNTHSYRRFFRTGVRTTWIWIQIIGPATQLASGTATRW